MPKGFQNGCPLPPRLRDQVSHTALSVLLLPRGRRGTCNKCKILGKETEEYRNLPCPHMKGIGKYRF